MTRLSIAIALSIFGLSVATTDARACGESMFHTGQGMRYHAFITRQPANILVYHAGEPDAQQKQLYGGLERAGHKVTVVTDESALVQALADKHFDLIIASAHDMREISVNINAAAPAPTLLAVVGDRTREQPLHDRFAHTLRENDGLNQYLKSIEQTMQARGA